MITFDERAGKEINRTLETVRRGMMAGIAGGLAEIAWVTLYAGATGGSPAMLARGVTTAAGANALFPADAVVLGVTVHMAIALALGIVLAFACRLMSSRRAQPISQFSFTIAALVGVWVINFFVVLPIVSPAFVHLVPYSVSLVSKLLFGVAAAGVFRLLAASVLTFRPARVARRS
jgi:hypothetical protein